MIVAIRIFLLLQLLFAATLSKIQFRGLKGVINARNILMQTTPSDANTLIKDVPSKSFHVISQKKFKTALLVVSYMSIIVSIMSFPSVMKLIDNDKQLRQNEHNLFPSTAEIVSTATMCIMGGKFLFGPVTDTIGGEAMLFICMIAMGSLLATCAFTGSLNNFAVSWTIISFFYASAWGAVGS
eukprot:gene409-587_t